MTEQGPFAHWQNALQPRQSPELSSSPGPNGLPPTFQFSQNSLQDYADCARRFQLRYVIGQRWPAAETEPIEDHEHFLEQGAEFHLLVQRHRLGIPAERLTPDDPLLKRWWDAYLDQPPADLPTGLRQPEVMLSTAIGEQRLLARFDLLALDPGRRAVIVDWKTARHRPSRQTLADRLQTRVYPFVLVEAGAHLFGGPIQPEQVSLIYWFAEDPARPEIFPYDSARHEATRAHLTDLIGEVLAHREEVWPLTPDERKCEYCVYRSFCGRDVRAGAFDRIDVEQVETRFDFELDDVDEIAF